MGSAAGGQMRRCWPWLIRGHRGDLSFRGSEGRRQRAVLAADDPSSQGVGVGPGSVAGVASDGVKGLIGYLNRVPGWVNHQRYHCHDVAEPERGIGLLGQRGRRRGWGETRSRRPEGGTGGHGGPGPGGCGCGSRGQAEMARHQHSARLANQDGTESDGPEYVSGFTKMVC